MDGGPHPEEICYKAKLIIQSLLQNLSYSKITDPIKVCNYFTERENGCELTTGTINIYLRYFSSFILFLHQSYSQIMPFEKYRELEQRIKRFVVHVYCKYLTKIVVGIICTVVLPRYKYF